MMGSMGHINRLLDPDKIYNFSAAVGRMDTNIFEASKMFLFEGGKQKYESNSYTIKYRICEKFLF